MAALEAVLRIGAQDDSDAAFAALKRHIEAIDQQVGVMDKLIREISKVAATNDPMVKSIAEAQQAINQQREAIVGVVSGLDQMERAGGAAGSAQARLAREVELATRAMARQGAEAYRVGEKVKAANARAAAGAPHGRPGALGQIADVLPFEGPVILDKTREAAAAGASVQERIAQLTAAGASAEDIAKAREDFREFSKTHAGVLESDYLAGYKDARVIAPGEAFEMAKHGATFRAALRNSGLPVGENDVGDALRIMDELGLNSDEKRKEFLNQILKTEQTFGEQVPVSTMLAAIRNAKQSVYQMSPDFINKYLPTLLQSAGQNGGTEIMTAYSNYIGQHMSHAEFTKLANTGFVDKQDLLYDKTGKVKGIKEGAQFFEENAFKSNVAQWSWDFHKQFMSRQGATEEGFEKLVAVMPRNMAAMIDFFVHNEARVKRDADTREGAIGDKAADNEALARNPIAGLDALKQSIENFAAAVTAPGMDKIGAGLAATAQGIQSLSAAVGDFAAKNPQTASTLGVGGIAAGFGIGGYYLWKLTTGLGQFFGLGGGSAPAASGVPTAAAPEAVAAEALGLLARRLGALGVVIVVTEALDPKGNFGGLTSGIDDWVKKRWGFDPSNMSVSDAAEGLAHARLAGESRAETRARLAREAADAERLAKYRNLDLNPLGLDRYQQDQTRFGLDREARRANAMSTLPDHGPERGEPSPKPSEPPAPAPAWFAGETRAETRARRAREAADAERLARYRNLDLNPLGLDRYQQDQARLGLDREARRANAMSSLDDHGPERDEPSPKPSEPPAPARGRKIRGVLHDAPTEGDGATPGGAEAVWQKILAMLEGHGAGGAASPAPREDLKVSLDPASKAQVTVDIRVTGDATATAAASSSGSLDLHFGRMDFDAAPKRGPMYGAR